MPNESLQAVTGTPICRTPICRVCGSADQRELARVPSVPVHVGLLWESAAAAQACPRGQIDLYGCPVCGLIYNLAFDPALVDYAGDYDNALHWSPRFRDYERQLAEGLASRYLDHDSLVVEVGCADGHFLGLLCRVAGCRGRGYDPSSTTEAAAGSLNDDITVERGLFDANRLDADVALVCARHVLEHVADPERFMGQLRGDGRRVGHLYVEVPDAAFVIEQASIGDIIYEHCWHFSADSLRHLAWRTGIAPVDVHTAFGGQFLGLEGRVTAEPAGAPTPHASHTMGFMQFTDAFHRRVSAWQDWSARMLAQGQRAVVWGAGAKTVTFGAVLDGMPAVDAVVDINPRKQGRFLAGTGHPIVAPAELRNLGVDVVVLMNGVYRDEVASTLSELNVTAPLVLADEL